VGGQLVMVRVVGVAVMVAGAGMVFAVVIISACTNHSGVVDAYVAIVGCRSVATWPASRWPRVTTVGQGSHHRRRSVSESDTNQAKNLLATACMQ
jgi:hypothetical protein